MATCVKCAGRSADGTVVLLDFSGCKRNTDTLSWGCCTAPANCVPKPGTTLCGGGVAGAKCQTMRSVEFYAAAGFGDSITVQYHDGGWAEWPGGQKRDRQRTAVQQAGRGHGMAAACA